MGKLWTQIDKMLVERISRAAIIPANNVSMGLCPKPRMHVHGHGEELTKRWDWLEQQNDDSSTFYRLHGSGQQVWGQCFKVLQNAHPVGVTQNFVGFFVVAIPENF